MIPRLEWPDERSKLAVKLWVEGKSSGQIASIIGMSRSATIGHISRAGKRIERETGVNPYKRPDVLHQAKGRKTKAPKAPKAKKSTDKPDQIKREVDEAAIIPGERMAPLVKLDSRLWLALPGTMPKDILDLKRTDCRWPIGENSPYLFCAADAIEGGSMCKTHSVWARVKQKIAA